MENFVEIFNNGVFTFVSGIFVIIAVYDVPVGFRYHGIGWFTILALFAMLCFNFGLIFKEIYEKLKEKKAELKAWWVKRKLQALESTKPLSTSMKPETSDINTTRPISAPDSPGSPAKKSKVLKKFSNQNRFQVKVGCQSFQSCHSPRNSARLASKTVMTAEFREPKPSY